MSKAITSQAAHSKAKEELKTRSYNLYNSYQKAKEYITAVHSSGWQDAHFKDLKTSFDKANEYIIPLKEFMGRASEHQKKTEAIVKKYNDLSSPKF